MAFTIEVCVDSIESAVAAVRGGATRLELCGNLGLGGGTTPSMGLFKLVKRACPNIPIMVMIRPRTGDFHYTIWEVDTMVEDIRAFKAAGAHGVVFGVLDALGNVDIRTTSRLAREASPLEVCFHRAFDMANDPVDAFTRVSQIPGVTRILTSGAGQKAVTPESLAVLKDLLERAASAETDDKLTILPGSGISPTSIKDVLDALLPQGLKEVHLSAGGWIPSAMRFRKKDMGMGVGGAGEWGIWRTSESVVHAVREIVDEMVPQDEEEPPAEAALEEPEAIETEPVAEEPAADESQADAEPPAEEELIVAEEEQAEAVLEEEQVEEAPEEEQAEVATEEQAVVEATEEEAVVEAPEEEEAAGEAPEGEGEVMPEEEVQAAATDHEDELQVSVIEPTMED